MKQYKNPTPTVDVILERDSNVLMVRRKNDPFKDHLSLPGGFVNEGETVEDWSTMITVIIQRDFDNADAGVVASNMAAAWSEGCPGAKAGLLVEDVTNGYPYVIWQYECPLNSETGKPETMMMKVIPGRDALYMIQYAVRAAPSIEFMKSALDYLGPEVSVCDTRIPERGCPEGM